MAGIGRRAIVALLMGLALVGAGCSSDDEEGTATAVIGDDTTTTDAGDDDVEGDVEGDDSDGSTDTTDPDDDGPGSTTSEGQATTTVEDDTATTEGETTTTTQGETTTTGTEPDSQFSLALSPDGFILVGEPSGSTTNLDFGDAKAFVMTGLTSALGPPDDEQVGGSPECGTGVASGAVWEDEISVSFDGDDTLLGWSLLRGSSLTDLTGMGLGTAVGDVTELDLDIVESSLGFEFSTAPSGPAFFGVVTGPGASDTITNMWAGAVCIAR
ncbi:MAG: hypothetical protein AAF467_24270 [Actinomycetota bacterium]